MKAWRDKAACLGQHQLFDSNQPDDMREAKTICGGWCSVQAECLDDAMAHEFGPAAIRSGVRGGLDPDQRAALGRRDRKEKASA